MASSKIKPDFPPLFPRGMHALRMAEARAKLVGAAAFRDSATRVRIWEHLEDIVRSLNGCHGLSGELWLDGSFVTEKIDPEDIDYLLRVPASIYDHDADIQKAVNWASSEALLISHRCDAYKWVECMAGHPLFAQSAGERQDWVDLFGKGWGGGPKGIIVVSLPAVMK